MERRVRRGTGTGERSSQQKSGKGSWGVNRYLENKEEHSVMRRGWKVECQWNNVNGKMYL